jgi:hypothetical protein
MLRRLLFVSALGFATACGGSSSPTAPATPPPLPTANLQPSGQASWGVCGPTHGCFFLTSIQNVGQGCASGTSVVARFLDANDAQRGSDVQMGAAGGLAAKTIRPNEVVAISSLGPTTLATDARVKSYRLLIAWNDVGCP